MRSILPKEVEVMGRKIPVHYLSQEAMSSMIQNAEGIWDTHNRCIYINKDAPQNVQLYYIFHEMVHAKHTFTGIDQSIDPGMIEVICQSTATLIEDILNSKLVTIYFAIKKLFRRKKK
jgi:hypothetical protein